MLRSASVTAISYMCFAQKQQAVQQNAVECSHLAMRCATAVVEAAKLADLRAFEFAGILHANDACTRQQAGIDDRLTHSKGHIDISASTLQPQL